MKTLNFWEKLVQTIEIWRLKATRFCRTNYVYAHIQLIVGGKIHIHTFHQRDQHVQIRVVQIALTTRMH